MNTLIQIPSFSQGVSQQADKLKLPTQMKEIINGYPSLIDGLMKRYPTKHIKKIFDTILPVSNVTIFEKDNSEKYILIINENGINIFDLEGNEKTINYETEPDYIKCSNPKYDLQTCVIGDHIFILNKTVSAKMKDDVFPNSYPNSAIIYVKQGDTQSDYKISVNGVEKAVCTTTTDENTAKTNVIAGNLVSALKTNLGNADWNTAIRGSVIFLQNIKGQNFEIYTTDSNGNRSLMCFKESAETVDDLPNIAVPNFVLKIVNNKQNTKDDYWVRFKPEKEGVTSITAGIWKECPCPGLKYKFDNTTLPHALVRNADGTFTYKALEYTDRQCGDDETSPLPNFIDKTISDIFAYKARLCFLSADRFIASSPSDIYSFCRETTITELDTEPIDIPASNVNTANLLYALPFNKELILFSKRQQHVVSTNSVLSNKNISIGTITNFECAKNVKPVSSGSNMYFAFERGSFTGVREFFIDQSQALDADDTTLHVANYIPKNVHKMSVSTLNDILFLLSEETEKDLYLYKFYYINSQKQQSAWVKWNFSGKIISADFIDNEIICLMQYPDGVYIEKIDLTANQFDIKYKSNENKDVEFIVFLDRKVVTEDCIYNEAEDETSFDVPYICEDDFVVVDDKGLELQVTKRIETEGKTNLTVNGKYNKVFAGIPYNFSVKFPTLYNRDESGTQVYEGDLQLLDLNISLSKTGYLKASVTPLYSYAMEYEYTGKILDTPSCEMDVVPITDGNFTIPVLCLNKEVEIEISNDTYLPSHILDAQLWADFIRN